MLNYDSMLKHIPSDNNYDVIVCGASEAGLSAAVASARTGARTLLLESGGRLFSKYRTYRRNETGFYGEFMELAVQAAAVAFGIPETDIPEETQLPPEILSMAAFKCLEKVGCHYRLYSPVTRVMRKGTRITGVTVATKLGERVFHGQVVIDATRSGEIARCAGCPAYTRRKDWRTTLGFVMMNADKPKFFDYLRRHETEVGELLRKASGEMGAGAFRFRDTLPGNALYIQGWFLNEMELFDETLRARQATQIRRNHLKMVLNCAEALSTMGIPGMEKAALMRTDESMSLHVHYRIENRQEDENSGPWDALVPVGPQNLLLASPALSASDSEYTALLYTGVSMRMGTVAGVMAALSSLNNMRPWSLTPETIEATLERLDAIRR